MEDNNMYKISKEVLEQKIKILVGNNNIRDEISKIVDSLLIENNKEEFQFLDINGNILLYGKPGFGKTSIIYEQMLKSKNHKYETYHLNIASLISEKMGKTAKAINDFFEKLIEESKTYKIVLLIEEIEVFLPNREGKDHDDMKRALTIFMHYMDNPIDNLIIFCTTNHKAMLDKAILRRFAFVYEINSVNSTMILEFLNHESNPFKDKIKNKDELAKKISEKKLSFSDIKHVMRKVYVANNFELSNEKLKEEIDQWQ